MSTTTREGDEVVLRLKVGGEAAGFARFLLGAADAFEAGHIVPTNPDADRSRLPRAAEQVRVLAHNIANHNAEART